MAESQDCAYLKDVFYDDPSQLSQLLRQRAGSQFAVSSTDSATNHSVNATKTSILAEEPSKNPQHDVPAFPPSPTPSPSRRVRFDSRHVTPRQSKHHTAPTGTGLLTEREDAPKMYQTFDGAVDTPGDTQMDPEIFKELTSGIYDGNSMSVVAPEHVLSAVEDGIPESVRDVAAVSTETPRAGANTTPLTMNDDPETQFRPNFAETSPLKLFETPTTYIARKRDSQGQALSSIARNTTPGTVLSASAFFGFGDAAHTNGMSLTQAFNATQAKTSPAGVMLNEDVVFQRPSPNFANPRHSSPDVTISSPIKVTNGKDLTSEPILRSSSEPRDDYETMKLSQERRSRERANQDPASIERQDSWGEPTGVEKYFIRQRARERLHQEAVKSLSGVSAPAPPAHWTRKRGFNSTRATTTCPIKAKAGSRADYFGPFDGAGADAPYELSQPLARTGDNEDSPDDMAREPFAVHQRRPARAIASKRSIEDQQVQVPHTSSHPLRTLSGRSRDLSQPGVSMSQSHSMSQTRDLVSQLLTKDISRIRSSKDTEVVMDSQPAPLRFPSSPSSNQYSVDQTTMLPRSGPITSPISSMIPMPPRSSSQVDKVMKDGTLERAEEGVPSSPPVVTPEDSISYDEHAYDEYPDEEQGEAEALAADDHDMDTDDDHDEDDLPVTRSSQGLEEELEDVKHEDDVHKGDEVTETTQQEHDAGVLIRSSHPEHYPEGGVNTFMGPPCMIRQTTIPETDEIEETQPSIFPGADNSAHFNASTHYQVDQNQNNSTEHFDTVKEQQSASQMEKEFNDTSKEGLTTSSPAVVKGPSLLDIANLPDTQRSVDLDKIDLPELSADEDSNKQLDAMMIRDSPFYPQKKRRTTYSAKKSMRSPIKDTDPLSERLTSSPQQGGPHERGWTPPTTQDREVQGAYTIPQARDEVDVTQSATLKSKTRLKPTQPQTPRAGALKSVRKTLLTKSPVKTPTKSFVAEDKAGQTTPRRSVEVGDADIEMRDAGLLNVDDERIPDADVCNVEQTIESEHDYGENPSGERIVPNRVFAYWPGQGYYPATCIGGGRQSRHVRVRYDDGTVNTLDFRQVRALDLRPENQVKIDVIGKKKLTYVVVGFKDKINLAVETMEYPLTDCYGYSTIVLEEKKRESLPAEALAQPRTYVAVPISSIYVTTQLWGRLRDRRFEFDPAASPESSTPQIETPKTIEATTPISNLPRKSTAGPSLLRDSTTRATSVASSSRSSSDVFLNMAFAITTPNAFVSKDGLGKPIMSNGGQVLDNGFHELFETESYDAPASSADSAKTKCAPGGLRLKAGYEDLRFVALIAQSHSRSPKYLQALALNIPCLHLRWVHDSLSAGRALPFAKYLLPAGTSTFLDPTGVVRSRDMPSFDPTAKDVTFLQMLKERRLLFLDQSVLIVSEENGQDPYIFLTRAMGAADIGQCSDRDEVKESVETGAWDWVYVDGKPDVLSYAAAEIFNTGNGKSTKRKPAKKRRRDESAKAESLVRSQLVGEKKVKVVCGEFVIQSLILGALVEE